MIEEEDDTNGMHFPGYFSSLSGCHIDEKDEILVQGRLYAWQVMPYKEGWQTTKDPKVDRPWPLLC